MEKICLNASLTLAFPDGFRQPDETEMQQLRAIQQGPGVCLRDDERHIIVSLGFRHAGLLYKLLNGKDLIQNAQSAIAGVMRPYGYRLMGYGSCPLGGKTAQYFQYDYTAKDIDMVGECCAIREGKATYYLHFYVRKGCSEEGFRVWREILAGAQWA